MIKKLKSNRGSASVLSGISMFLSIVLIFSGVKVYEISSKGASIQEAADASALAAEAQVAKFVTAANIADAGVYAMNLTQVSLFGASVVAACMGNIPASATYVEKAVKVGQARTKYANAAKKTLNALQKALPVSSAAKAGQLAGENEDAGTSIFCTAVLVPLEGEELEIDTTSLDEKGGALKDSAERAQKLGEELAELNEELDAIKVLAWKLDCGNNPAYCLYERASSLSVISASDNPFYSSADAWDFNVAFLRSRAYFANRGSIESPSTYTDVREQARSYLRRDYFDWVSKKINECYTGGKQENELYAWPTLYHNTDEFRASERYSESIYPIANGKMHANANLPCAAGASGLGSCADFDSGAYEECPECEFSTRNVAQIGLATTNTTVGFEHYFKEISELKAKFDDKQKEYEAKSEELNKEVRTVADQISDFLIEAKNARINVTPPGDDGAVAIASVEHNSESTTIANAFVTSTIQMGTGMAVSGATLKVDEDESGLALIFDRLRTEDGIEEEAIESVAGEKGASFFFKSQSGLIGGVLNKVAKAAIKTIEDAIDSIGLEPPDLNAYKPAIVNTSEVVATDDGAFAKAFRAAKENAGSFGDLAGIVDGIKEAAGTNAISREWQ